MDWWMLFCLQSMREGIFKKRLMDKITLDEKHYQGLSQLMSAGDEDAILALQTMEACNFNPSLSCILMVLKTGSRGWEFWERHTTTLWEKIKAVGALDKGVLTYTTIMHVLFSQKCGIEQQQFVLSQYAQALLQQLQEWNYTEAIDVEIKIITDGQATNTGGEPVESE